MNENINSREQDTERRILEAAAKVFMMKGKLGTSMQDIADEAGINRTLLHYYYRKKDKLFDTVFEKVFSRVFPALVGIISSEMPFIEKLEKFVEVYTNLLHENPYLPIFIFQEISLNPERLVDTLKGIGFNPEFMIIEFESELEGSEMEGMDPRHLLANLMGMILFPYIGRSLFQTIAFQDNAQAYDQFLEDRKKQIPVFLKMAFLGAGIQK